MSFIVTGCGRSGTTRMKMALEACGAAVNQEGWFNPYREKVTEDDVAEYLSLGWSDVSWLAAPFITEFNVPVLHLVRHPVDVANSFLYLGDFREGIYGAFIGRHVSLTLTSELRDVLIYWDQWNALCERAKNWLLVRVEDMAEKAETIERFLGIRGLQEAWVNTPEYANRQSGYRRIVSRDCVVNLPSDVRERMMRYGYE